MGGGLIYHRTKYKQRGLLCHSYGIMPQGCSPPSPTPPLPLLTPPGRGPYVTIVPTIPMWSQGEAKHQIICCFFLFLCQLIFEEMCHMGLLIHLRL